MSATYPFAIGDGHRRQDDDKRGQDQHAAKDQAFHWTSGVRAWRMKSDAPAEHVRYDGVTTVFTTRHLWERAHPARPFLVGTSRSQLSREGAVCRPVRRMRALPGRIDAAAFTPPSAPAESRARSSRPVASGRERGTATPPRDRLLPDADSATQFSETGSRAAKRPGRVQNSSASSLSPRLHLFHHCRR